MLLETSISNVLVHNYFICVNLVKPAQKIKQKGISGAGLRVHLDTLSICNRHSFCTHGFCEGYSECTAMLSCHLLFNRPLCVYFQLCTTELLSSKENLLISGKRPPLHFRLYSTRCTHLHPCKNYKPARSSAAAVFVVVPKLRRRLTSNSRVTK